MTEFRFLHQTGPTGQPTPQVVALSEFGTGTRATLSISVFTSLALLGVWAFISWLGVVPRLFLPTPAEVGKAFITAWQEGYAHASLGEHLGTSLGRIVAGALIAISLGVPVGLIMGLNHWAKGVLDAPIEFYWPLPPLAYLPLMIIWLGIGETSKITLLALAMFAPVALSAQAGVRSVPLERVHAALSLGASRWQLFRDIVLPTALPELLTGVRIALGIGWSTLVAAELIAANRGIGFMIMSASHFLATDVVFVGIALIAACALLFSLAMRWLERRLVPWKGRS